MEKVEAGKQIYYRHQQVTIVTAGRETETGFVTIAVLIDPEGSLQTAQCAVAWCSPKDQFARWKGRLIATNRLGTKPVEFVTPVRAAGGSRGRWMNGVFDNALNAHWDRRPLWMRNGTKKQLRTDLQHMLRRRAERAGRAGQTLCVMD